MTVAVLGLGGNVGDVRATMAAALDRLAAIPGIRIAAVSALYSTPPWGKTDQPDFLNAAALLETGLPPRGLLDAVLGVERALGRERQERWGPRTIDIDILLYGEERIDEPGLSLPHARLAERAFALLPLADVLPAARFSGRAVGEWLAEADVGGVARVAGPEWREAAAPAAAGEASGAQS
jgi:2-amino-4-hydroxy-6-hydroxymethyldihydropteridine diphosphokinase